VLSGDVELEHGLLPAGQTKVFASGLVTFAKGAPPRMPQIVLLKNIV
jgi:hypothetical protein